MSRRIDKLTADTQVKLNAAIEDMKRNGIKFFIDSTLRTTEEQQALFSQGREALSIVNQKRSIAGMTPIGDKDNGYTVTNCDGIKNRSRHQSGKAVDIAPVDSRGNPYWPAATSNAWQLIAGCMKKQGFISGLYWSDFVDPPHHELP